MLMEYLALISVIIFAILVFFIIRTLLVINRILQNVDSSMLNLETRLKSIDPLLRSISNLGDICEDKTSHLKEQSCKHCSSISEEKLYYKRPHEDFPKGELAEWILLSANLATKFFKRRGI